MEAKEVMDINEIRRENMRYLCRKAGDVSAMAEIMQVSESRIRHLIGRTPIKNIGDRTARKLEQLFKMPKNWMDHPHPELWGDGGGQGQLRAGKQQEPQPREPGDEFVPIRQVKIRPNAGITGFAIEVPEEDGKPIFFRADWLAEKGWKTKDLIALRVNGSSMEPSLYDGDLIVINMDATEPKESEVYVLNLEGEIVVKRLHRERGQWIAASDNPDKRRYPDKPIDSEHAKIVGRVVYKQSEVI